MVLHNPNNWHWVNKDASAWAKQYMEENIKTLKAEENGVTAQVDKLISMDGDVDVNQRKGKVITIFDVKLVIEYSGEFVPDSYPTAVLTKQAKPRMMRMSAAPSRYQRWLTIPKKTSTLYVSSIPSGVFHAQPNKSLV